MKKLIYLLIILPFLWQCTSKEKKQEVVEKNSIILELNLKGKEYSEITLIPYNTTPPYISKKRNTRFDIEGENIEGNKWIFTIPSSTRKTYSIYTLETSSNDSNNPEKHFISFSSKELHHRMKMWNVPMEKKNDTYISCKYVETRTDSLQKYYYFDYDFSDSTSVNSTITQDLFYIEIDEKEVYPEWELEFVYPQYGLMPEDDAKYAEKMEEYITLAKKYPESVSLLSRIGPGRGFRSKEDIKKVYNTFSEEARKKHEEFSPHEKEYMDYPTMNTDIKKLKLKNYKTGSFESVIKDKSKPTLVLFSCIGWNNNPYNTITISALKDIYKEKAPPLDIVFINIDFENTDKWIKLIMEEETPWRNLHVEEKENFEISDTYQYWGIESGILINTDGSIKVLHIYNIDRLKEIINNY